MYQKGDLLWIPAGTLLMRPRVFGEDDLFSNYFQTLEPCVGLFLNFYSRVVLSEGNQTRVLTVVGTPSEVHNKVRKRQVLRG